MTMIRLARYYDRSNPAKDRITMQFYPDGDQHEISESMYLLALGDMGERWTTDNPAARVTIGTISADKRQEYGRCVYLSNSDKRGKSNGF